LYEDQTLIVLNKPAGLLSVPLPREDEASLQAQVQFHLKSQHKQRAFVVHRIDRDTSGLVVFAKDFKTQQKLKDQFAARQPERVYWAFVYGVPAASHGEWRDLLVWDDEVLRQRQPRAADAVTHEAISRYRVVETFAEAALLEVTLVTGKRNQIRMQAALRGHQLIGEKRYVNQSAPRRLIEFPRQALHALRLGLRHPVDGRTLTFEAPLPADLQQLHQKLKRAKA
jgi:23S rRNA pseudouridine1911/1915/1917 synthase